MNIYQQVKGISHSVKSGLSRRIPQWVQKNHLSGHLLTPLGIALFSVLVGFILRSGNNTDGVQKRCDRHHSR
jgi:hypothetical protein